MSIATRIFISSMTFGILVAVAYWWDTREVVGTFLLGLFAVGFAFVVAFLLSIRSKTKLDGDEQRAPAELAGEEIAVVSAESPWPVVLAVCATCMVIGIVLHPMLAVFALAAFLVVIWQLVRESV
ncbi:MAG TPA: cytochrome c oxidase subunit 4 [Candidatus Baltobacteraceae bacterium]|nr:cytochrome c oxidase subunit 4 [Candidatus Baltobacteraceae bacterium]